jgi:sec-independent protein translocase protein TatA
VSAMTAVTMPGGWELIVILFIVLLFFGARKLPDLAGSMGRSIREFRKATNDGDEADADVDGQRDSGSTSAAERDTER